MRPLDILILSDGRPGHYHLADGVAAAIARRRATTVTRREVRRQRIVPNRALAWAVLGGVPLAAILRYGYGLGEAAVPEADLVISAGGETMAANVAVARLRGARNIYCGTVRRLPPEAFSLIVSSYARHAGRAHHLVTLKPNGIDPDTLAAERASRDRRSGTLYGLLVGGDSGLFRYTNAEWDRLAAFLGEAHRATGARWVVSTSRRTSDYAADALEAVAAAPASPIAELIDFRRAGPGTLPHLFASVDAILATEDSSTMISEAVCARLPVIGAAPAEHAFKDEEREYRAFMRDRGWCRFLPLGLLTPATFAAALAEVTPLAENHLERLSGELASRLPELFR